MRVGFVTDGVHADGTTGLAVGVGAPFNVDFSDLCHIVTIEACARVCVCVCVCVCVASGLCHCIVLFVVGISGVS